LNHMMIHGLANVKFVITVGGLATHINKQFTGLLE